MTSSQTATLDIKHIRENFPILHQKVNGKPLIYFDNAATTQKPKSVIDALVSYYSGYNANIHRGIHTLAEKATQAFEDTRMAVQKFIGANEAEEIIFVRGVTEAINLVASSYGRWFLQEGDEVIITALEHHSNIVPWQMICQEKGAHLKVVPVDNNGELNINQYRELLSDHTRLVSFNHASNSLGTINPVQEMTKMAHQHGAIVFIDGAQAGAHLDINVQSLDCDFYCLSAHKMYGPTGIGILYGKRHLLEKMKPYQGGGEMIKEVTFSHTTFNDIPYKFEAGTPNIADAIALKSAIDFITTLGKAQMAAYEQTLLTYATEKLEALPRLKIIGTAQEKVSVVSFIVEGIHHFDIGQMLDTRGIAVRTGHHCTQPLMERFGIEGTVRASLAVYNTTDEIDQLVEGMKRIINFMQP